MRRPLFMRLKTASLIFIVPLVFGLDRLSKWWVLNSLGEGESLRFTFFFYLTRVNNTGAAFGLFKNFRLFLVATAVVCVAALSAVLWRRHSSSAKGPAPADAASLLIVGGALGNLYDRLRYGYVIDFLDFRVWPVFNAADASITIGIGLVFLQIFYRSQSR